MKPYEIQELEQCGFFSKMFGSKPAENGWKELNNLLAQAASMDAVTAADVQAALKKWGVKFNDENLQQLTLKNFLKFTELSLMFIVRWLQEKKLVVKVKVKTHG